MTRRAAIGLPCSSCGTAGEARGRQGASRRCARRTPGLQRVLRPLRCRLGLLGQTSLHYLSQYHNDPDEVIVQIEVREPEERAADGIADQAHLYHRGEIARPDEVRPLL